MMYHGDGRPIGGGNQPLVLGRRRPAAARPTRVLVSGKRLRRVGSCPLQNVR